MLLGGPTAGLGTTGLVTAGVGPPRTCDHKGLGVPGVFCGPTGDMGTAALGKGGWLTGGLLFTGRRPPGVLLTAAGPPEALTAAELPLFDGLHGAGAVSLSPPVFPALSSWDILPRRANGLLPPTWLDGPCCFPLVAETLGVKPLGALFELPDNHITRS
jgi:hypothetical protein